MLDAGIYFRPPLLLSVEHSEDDIKRTIASVKQPFLTPKRYIVTIGR